MLTLEKYESLLDVFPALRKNNNLDKKIPKAFVEIHSCFVTDFGDNSVFSNEASEVLKAKKTLFGKKSVHYLIAAGGRGSTEKIRDYYKLWKALGREYDISKFILSKDYKIVVNNESYYVGVITFDLDDINKIIDIMQSYMNNSFICITENMNLIHQENIEKLFRVLLEGKFDKIGHQKLDVIGMCDYLYKNDAVIYLAFDGEEEALFCIQKM